MSDMNKIVKSAMTGILALTTATVMVNVANAAPADSMEKCYGIVKAAMNDCQTATASCAGSATKDKQADAFIFLPKGTCNKIAGSNLKAPADSKSK